MKYVIPAIIFATFVAAAIKKLPVYDLFTKGAKEAISLSVSLFPYILAMNVLVELMTSSGFIELLTKILSPVLGFLGIPSGIFPLVVFRPFSGSGSIALLENVLKSFGADSFEGRAASVIAASSETVLYMGAVYFSSVKSKGSGKVLLISLFVGFVGVILSVFFCRIM